MSNRAARDGQAPGSRTDALAPARLEIPRSSSGYSYEVSPPDSPHTGDIERSSSPNISPITDGDGSRSTGPSSRPSGTSIPQPVSSSTSGTSAYIAGWRDKVGAKTESSKRRDSRPTKWDKYSGEPTDGSRGAEGSAKPGDPAFDRPPLGHSAMVTATNPQSKANIWSQTLKRVGQKSTGSPTTATAPAPREEWKGASGRQALVDPVADKPSQNKPKALPTPSQRRKQAGAKQAISAKHAVAVEETSGQTAGQSPAARRVAAQSQSPPLETASDDNGGRGKRRIADEFIRRKRLSLGTVEDDLPARTSSLPGSQVSTPMGEAARPWSPGTDSGLSSPSGLAATSGIDSLALGEPGSRFSATTLATTQAGSRPESPEQIPSPPEPSILHRKRPIPSTPRYPGEKRETPKSGSKAPSRKPTPSQIMSGGNGSGSGEESAFAPPPPPPPEPEEVDKVTQLETHIKNLNRRKQNLLTVINELTNVAQPASITYDRTSRSEIRKTVSGMNAELDAVTKEIHESGLKLHRALRRRDEDAGNGSGGLWIRRVTE